MLIIGLTGSIGMGKSTVAGMFRQRGIGVFDADAEVHRLYAGGNSVARIEAAFPGTTIGGRVDRSRLAAALASDAARFRVLEKIVHPLVRDAEQRFLDDANRGAAVAVLEIPLLFETGLNAHVDVVVVVSAPADVQKARVLDRPGLSAARLEALLAQQLSDDEKRRRADFVVDTGTSLADTEAQVDKLLSELNPDSARAYEHHWRGR